LLDAAYQQKVYKNSGTLTYSKVSGRSRQKLRREMFIPIISGEQPSPRVRGDVHCYHAATLEE
jgi:hypothetical protein